ncbi:alkaline phosphatase family protein [Flagellimonas oceani]|nr:ectonucleotide pyrophosphatase/phosphodiesterase [Allomuricauda oceani]
MLLGLAIFQSVVAQEKPKHVVVISIDGFRPEFYMDSSMPTPNLQEMFREGVAAKEVTGIFPTVTYPSHTTLITGTTPKEHGIYYNTLIKEDGSAGGWVYDFREIKSKTLWQAAKEKGLVTASVSWPVSVNAQYIDYNIPEFWSFENPMDRRGATSEKANPKGLFEEVVKNATGTLEINDYNLSSLTMDQNLARIAGYLLRKYRPNLLTIHLPITDGAQHRQGRKGLMVRKAIAGADNAIGVIRDALQKAGIEKETTIIVTGDHGFVDVHTQIAPNVLLAQHGLYEKKGGRPKAFFFSAGGSAFLHLRDENDEETLERIQQLFEELPIEIRSTFDIVNRDQIAIRGGDPRVRLALTAQRGYSFSNDTEGSLMTYKKGGKHGYYPNFHDIATGFVGDGKGMQKGEVIENMYLEDVGKIVASLLQLQLNQDPNFYHSTLKNGN